MKIVEELNIRVGKQIFKGYPGLDYNKTKEEIIKRKDMEELIESILDYVRADYTDYAIMINGEWGSRKNTFLE